MGVPRGCEDVPIGEAHVAGGPCNVCTGRRRVSSHHSLPRDEKGQMGVKRKEQMQVSQVVVSLRTETKLGKAIQRYMHRKASIPSRGRRRFCM